MKKMEIMKTFSERANYYNRETEWVDAEYLISPLVPYPLHNKDRLLDVCSGTGALAKQALKQGWSVTALDINENMLEKIKSNKIVTIKGDAQSMPFCHNEFDLVVMRQALHYFEINKIINEMKRVSKGAIRLGHITMHSESDLTIWKQYFKIASPGRIHVFSPGQISRELHKNGCEVVSEDVLFSYEIFEGPILHLGSQIISELRELMQNSSAKFKKNYELRTNAKGELIMKLRWEFHDVFFKK